MNSHVTTSSVIVVGLNLTSHLLSSAHRSDAPGSSSPFIATQGFSAVATLLKYKVMLSSPPPSFHLCFLNKVLLPGSNSH